MLCGFLFSFHFFFLVTFSQITLPLVKAKSKIYILNLHVSPAWVCAELQSCACYLFSSLFAYPADVYNPLPFQIYCLSAPNIIHNGSRKNRLYKIIFLLFKFVIIIHDCLYEKFLQSCFYCDLASSYISISVYWLIIILVSLFIFLVSGS